MSVYHSLLYGSLSRLLAARDSARTDVERVEIDAAIASVRRAMTPPVRT